ncbi:hypothetical protein [Actinomadura rupiterrae]|uniref:hypothetical protein n=1 Tax=Actinomadura rupiterrae TaxID=559627 RepID=UPI0020A3E5CE|nr:hypothetical protein [Actinomadura rupiterrae]MCP2338265.1 hypothetical protein [Actinomadura rupiterrae]
MWLNLLMMGVASLAVGFVLGWIVACPRRWDAHYCDETAPGHDFRHAPAPRADQAPAPATPGADRVPVRARLTALARHTIRA